MGKTKKNLCQSLLMYTHQHPQKDDDFFDLLLQNKIKTKVYTPRVLTNTPKQMNTTTLPHRHPPPHSLDVYVYVTNTRETKYNIRYKYTLLDTTKQNAANRAPPPQRTHTRYSHTLKGENTQTTHPPSLPSPAHPSALTSSTLLTSALCPRSSSATSLWPCCAAWWRGVLLRCGGSSSTHRQTGQAPRACVCVGE